MPGDIYSALTGAPPTTDEQRQTLINALRNQQTIGQIGALTGDKVLAPFGQNLANQSTSEAEAVGRNYLTEQQRQQTKAYQDAEVAQQKNALAETIRQHNLENQQKMWEYGIGPSGQVDPSFAKMVDDIGQLRAPPLNPSATRNPRNFNVMQAVYDKYPQYDGSQWKNKQATVEAFGKGPQGNLVRSADVGIQHLGVLGSAIDQLNNSPVKFLNEGANFIKTHLGLSAAPTNFDGVKNIVAAEINKFIEGGGTGAGAVTDREELRKDLDAANSAKLLHGVVDKWKELMKGQIIGLKRQYEANTYGTMKDFNSKLKPETRQELGLEEPNANYGTSGWKIEVVK